MGVERYNRSRRAEREDDRGRVRRQPIPREKLHSGRRMDGSLAPRSMDGASAGFEYQPNRLFSHSRNRHPKTAGQQAHERGSAQHKSGTRSMRRLSSALLL